VPSWPEPLSVFFVHAQEHFVTIDHVDRYRADQSS
jgi:hypothetical protein